MDIVSDRIIAQGSYKYRTNRKNKENKICSATADEKTKVKFVSSKEALEWSRKQVSSKLNVSMKAVSFSLLSDNY